MHAEQAHPILKERLIQDVLSVFDGLSIKKD
jgi:hypothetical protein